MLLPNHMDPNAVPHEALAQRQRVFQTGVFICLMLLLMDPRDPRREQEAAVARARAEAEAAALRRQRAPTWLDGAVGGGARRPQNVTGLYRGSWSFGNGTAPADNREARLGGDTGRAVVQMDMFRLEELESISLVRALVSLSAPPGGARGRRDIFASAFGVYFHGARTAALLGNVGEPTEAGVDLERRNATGRNATAGAAAPGSDRGRAILPRAELSLRAAS